MKDSLADNEFYLIAIDYKPTNTEGEVFWRDLASTKGTNWLANEHKYLLDQSADGLFSWSVTLILGQTVDSNDVPQGPALSQASEERAFVWVGATPGDKNGGKGPVPP